VTRRRSLRIAHPPRAAYVPRAAYAPATTTASSHLHIQHHLHVSHQQRAARMRHDVTSCRLGPARCHIVPVDSARRGIQAVN
jgi:hypothetical protein